MRKPGESEHELKRDRHSFRWWPLFVFSERLQPCIEGQWVRADNINGLLGMLRNQALHYCCDQVGYMYWLYTTVFMRNEWNQW